MAAVTFGADLWPSGKGSGKGAGSGGAVQPRRKMGAHQGTASQAPASSKRAGHGPLVDSPAPGPPVPSAEDLETLGRASGIAPQDRVFLFDGDSVRVVTIAQARKAGYRIVDLSDDHVPFIFSEQTPGLSDRAQNEYQKTYVDVANDRTDESGRPLGPDQHNYVELFGIHPSLSVLQKRFLGDEAKACYDQLDTKLLSQFRAVIRYRGGKQASRELDRFRILERQVRRAEKRTGRRSLSALAKLAKYRWLVRAYRRAQVRVEVINQTQLRLKCEGLLGAGEHVRRRVFDYVTHRALSRFERKHMIFGWGQLYGKTLKYLGSSPLVNNHRALLRVLRERVADSLGIIEDGSVLDVPGLDATYEDGGTKKPVPNLIASYTKLVAKALHWSRPADALAFFKAQRPALFTHFRIGVRLPSLPPYYSDKMRFVAEIDRGDVWYEYPYDAAGHRRSQPRSRMPHLVLYTIWKDQKIPLARYQTTIGGWRKEHKDGKVYLKYKNSDVGPRVWRDIVAAPVWIPPESTPPSALVTKTKIDGKWRWRVKRDEIGPSYLSAYGLVAAYHLQKIGEGRAALWRDNGIRTHGSVAYMSIFGGFSHGCHRLHNHLAVRLFSFILRHSNFRRRGQIPLRYGRTFSYRGQSYKILLHTRGYYYTLTHPVEVVVKEGRIRGKVKEPIERYMRVPGEKYDPEDPNLKADAGDTQGGWSGPDSLPENVPPADAEPIHPASPDLPADAVKKPHLPAGPAKASARPRQQGAASRRAPTRKDSAARSGRVPGLRPSRPVSASGNKARPSARRVGPRATATKGRRQAPRAGRVRPTGLRGRR